MLEPYLPLLANLGLATAIVTISSQLIEHPTAASPRVQAILLGLMLGVGAIIAMLVPMVLAPGVIVDLRAVLLALAGLFGGPLAALLAMALALACRVALGGIGMGPGIAAILVASAAGLIAGRRYATESITFGQLIEVGAGVAIATFSTVFLLPQSLWDTLVTKVALPFLLMTTSGVALIGMALVQAERRHELARTNGLYRAMVEALPDCLNVKDRAGRFLVANAATARLMRVPSGDALVGKSDADFYPAEIAAVYRADELRFLATGTAIELEQSTPEANGHARWLATMKSPLYDAHGQTIGIITHNRDITLRKRIELELAEAQMHLHDAIASIDTGLELFDAHDRLVVANEALKEMFPDSFDLRVPGINGVDLIRAVAARGEYKGVAVSTVEAWVAAHRAGGDEDSQTVIELINGRWIEASSRRTSLGGRVVVYRDVTERHHRECELEHRATHDPLTGLANRALFERELARAHRLVGLEGGRLAVMLLDLDHFKAVNDTHGHAAGDSLLVAVTKRLTATVRDGDVVARLGGDEFAILARGRSDMRFELLAERLLAQLGKPLLVKGIVLTPAATIGFTTAPDDAGEPVELLANADRALYAAKKMGRGRWAMHRAAAAAPPVESLVDQSATRLVEPMESTRIH